MCMYIYIYIDVHIYIYVYIYVYIDLDVWHDPTNNNIEMQHVATMKILVNWLVVFMIQENWFVHLFAMLQVGKFVKTTEALSNWLKGLMIIQNSEYYCKTGLCLAGSAQFYTRFTRKLFLELEWCAQLDSDDFGYLLVNKRSYGKWPFIVDFPIKIGDFP